MTEVSKTTITFTVLHRSDDPALSGEETWGEYNHAYDGPLGYLMQESWDGGMVGLEGDWVTVPVPDDQVKAELLKMGNDGTFFNDDLGGST